MASTADWPAHTVEVRPWRQTRRAGTREDRMLTQIEVAIPPKIATLDYALPPDLLAEAERATFDVGHIEGTAATQLAALGRFLIQTESVSSSKIEQLDADTEQFARALAGSRANESATSMVAATAALAELIARAGHTATITLEDILSAHHTLMRGDPHELHTAGQLRDVQNWILGSDYSPRGAVHIPPPPELVPEYMDDLLQYANRNDIPPLMQAAAVHAQFEAVHPFTDGNGRIGRALINAVLRRRGVTRHTVIPIATAMVADRDGYFELMNGYRRGELGPFVRNLIHSATLATAQTLVTAKRFHDLPIEWRETVRPRAGSAVAAILEHLTEHPVMNMDVAARLTSTTPQSIYTAMARLESDGIVHEITGRARDRVWAATEVLAELDELSARIAAAVRR